MGKAWEHSSRQWTQGECRGKELIFKYVCTKLESKFLTSQDNLVWLNVWRLNDANGQSSALFVVEPLPPPSYINLLLTVAHGINDFPFFRCSSASMGPCVTVNTKGIVNYGAGLGMRQKWGAPNGFIVFFVVGSLPRPLCLMSTTPHSWSPFSFLTTLPLPHVLLWTQTEE